MAKKDPRVDQYIAEAAPFARPILRHLRKTIHRGCPAAVETIKWHTPFFDYKGLLCGMAAFKAHCALFFWRDVRVRPQTAKSGGRGQFGRITCLADLPSDAHLLACLREAVAQRDAGKTVKAVRRPAKDVPVPADLRRALASTPKAAANFRDFSPSHRREYVTWITEAKRPETRARRLATALTWIADGKHQNWKYER
jgi:uncharacterized protein YdeI (YjbR/CyaY-like superfamily)